MNLFYKTLGAVWPRERKKKMGPVEKEKADKIMNIKDLMVYIKMSERKIRQMIHDKEIPYSRVGGCSIRFDRDEINRWIKMNSVKSKVS